MSEVAIVDYGMCNLDSIGRAVEECGGRPIITENPDDLKTASHIILPGVGAFPNGMKNLVERGFAKVLNKEVLENGVPFLGICLGMQLMARKSHEGGSTEGLGWIDGDVLKLEPYGEDTRIPHIAWNEVYPEGQPVIFENIEPGKDFYFVHSYHLACENKNQVLATTPYAAGFVSAVGYDNIFGVQFHPEKSQKVGFQVLRNFLSL
ncbi:MAG: imidazole glycerol phosphate synthase subunit HisH [Candidatus Zixiibacteriota bacterium]